MLYVNCSKCGNKHFQGEIETLNIEEDIQGYDVITFVCPETKEETKSYVLAGPDFDPNWESYFEGESK